MNGEDAVSHVRVLAVCGGMVTSGGAERMVFEVLRALRVVPGGPRRCG